MLARHQQKRRHRFAPPGRLHGCVCLGRIFLTKSLILNHAMMRATTAIILLVTVLSAPLASAVCGDCCNVEHPAPLCHNQEHAHLGPHAHHMNHQHMVTQELEASVVIQQCEHQVQNRRRSCHRAACLSAKPVPASIASVAANQLQIISRLPAVTISSSFPAVRAHSPSSIYEIETSSSSASTPLRI